MNNENSLSPACIVLVRPEGDANIGAVCRAMKSMGFFSLRLVLPDLREPDEEQVHTWALSAFDIFEKAARFESLGQALADRDLAAGFTRRTGARRKGRVAALEEFVPLAAGRRYALVFGSESSGLTGEELEACSLAVTIPTDEAFSLPQPLPRGAACLLRSAERRPRRGDPCRKDTRDHPARCRERRVENMCRPEEDRVLHALRRRIPSNLDSRPYSAGRARQGGGRVSRKYLSENQESEDIPEVTRLSGKNAGQPDLPVVPYGYACSRIN